MYRNFMHSFNPRIYLSVSQQIIMDVSEFTKVLYTLLREYLLKKEKPLAIL